MHTFKPVDLISMPLEGTSLIEASAGTGKTFTISQLYVRLLIEKGLAPENILVVTFTEAATKELRDRIRKNLTCASAAAENPAGCQDETIRAILEKGFAAGGGRESVQGLLRKAVVGFDEAAIFTIHGFCKRMLSDNSFESALLFDTELVTDQRDIIQEITDDFWRASFCGGDALAGAIARKNGLAIPGLMKLAEEIIRKPFLKILPEPITASPDRIIGIFDDLRREWEQSSGVIKELLLKAKGLRREKDRYKEDNLENLFQELDAAFSGAPTAQNLKAVNLFSSGTLAESKSLKKDGEPPQHRFFDLCDAFGREEGAAACCVQGAFISYVQQELSRRKKERTVQSFDDLLLDLLGALEKDGGGALARAISGTYRAALIDEFQDTDPVQYEIFDRLFNVKGQALFLIGDPKQSIYGFRGADIFSYIEAAAKTDADKKYTLATNRRSGTTLVEAANHFFGAARNPFVPGPSIAYLTVKAAQQSVGNQSPLVIEGDDPLGLRIRFLRQDSPLLRGRKLSSKENAVFPAVESTVAEIARILNLSAQGKATIGGRPVRPSDFAVLVLRNADASRFVGPLTRLNIPVVLAKTGSVFHTPEAEDMERLLRALVSPGNLRAINAALATAMAGYDAEQIRQFMEDEKRLSDYEGHLQAFSGYLELWNTKGFMRMFRTFLADYQVRQRLLRLPGGERRLTNVLHLAEVLHRASLENSFGANGLLSFLARQRADEAEQEEHELRLERDDEAVQILTVFKSKGLQYPIVFCPFMWQQGAADTRGEVIFHRNKNVYLDLGSADRESTHRPRASRERLSELVRLLYVGITRAQNRCYLTCGKIGREAATALDYLFTGGSDEGDDAVESLLGRIKALKEEAFYEAVSKYIEPARGSIGLDAPLPVSSEPYNATEGQEALPLCFRRPAAADIISRDWGVASYSLLAASDHHGAAVYEDRALQHDELYGQDTGYAAKAAEGFFAFPRGAVAGSCIHSIFERLDFSDGTGAGAAPLIEQALKNYGLADPAGQSDRAAAAQDMISRVLSSSLLPGNKDFSLQTLTGRDRLSELAFFYPLQRITPETLQAAFKKYTGAGVSSGFPEKIGRLQFRPIEGFMQGFIDLVFQYEGRYYLLDWKTNHLGNSYDDYAPDRIAAAMEEKLYNLQYAIYTVALHKYLEQHIAGYRYEEHFGGAVYLFVRGVTPGRPGNGIFFDLPPPAFVEALEGLCC